MINFKKLYDQAAALARPRELTHNSEFGDVGASLLAGNGKQYSGASLHSACGIGTCAEHAAILDMLKEGESKIIEVVAVNDKGTVLPPCGRCRELMMQINKNNSDTLVHLPNNDAKKLGDIFPNYWF